MTHPKGRAKGLTTSKLMTNADRCISILARLYVSDTIRLNKAQAKQELILSNEDLPPVLRILEDLEVITTEDAAGEKYEVINILPRAVELAHRDLVEHWFSRFRRRRLFAGLIGTAVVLTAVAAAVNQGFTVVRNLYPAGSNPHATVTYKGHPPEYWTDQLQDLDSGTARGASNEVRRLGAHAVPGLLRALHSGNGYTVELAVRTLGNIGQAATGAVPELEQLERTQPALKGLVEEALGKIRKR